MSKIIITDGQTDDILATIWKKDVIINEHEEDKPSLLNKLEFTAYADRPYAKHLHGLNRLLIMDEDGKWIELVIARTTRYSVNGEYKIDVIALASYLQVKKAKVIKPHKTAAQSAEAHMRQIFAETEIEVGYVVHTGTESIEYENITNPFNAAKMIANKFKLELQYRVEANENKITRRYVDLVGQVGEWRGRQVEFGRDLIKIERIEDTSEIYTAVHAFGPEQEDGNRLEVIVEDQDALQRWGRDKHLVYVYEPESTDQDMTLGRLRQLARTKLDELIVAFISYEGDIIDLEGLPGLENKKIRIGDSIYIKDTKFEPPLYVEARIFNQKRDIFVKDKKVVKLGDYKEYSVEETHAIWRDLQHEIEERLKKVLLVTITSDAGTIFKNGQGETTLTANLFASGHETDINGTAYTYKWSKTNLLWELVEFAEGKEVTVTAADVNIATIFLLEVIKNGTVMTKAQITVTNVDDGKDGAKGEKGDPGVPGVPGPPGEDGQALYTWVKYATDDKGSNMSDLPAGRSHIGFAYNKPTQNESTNPADYEWAKIEGDQGTKGADGETYYTWLKYADTPTSGMSDSPAGKTYMGLAYNKTSPNESTNYADYSWSLIKGEKGDKGDRGPQGPEGTGVSGVIEYYLASSASSGVTTGTAGWTTTIQTITPSKKYLWNYERINFSDGTSQNTTPVIIGVYGEKGDDGDPGRSITRITEYYLATNLASGVTRSTSGWTTAMQRTTEAKKYLWNYEQITWSSGTTTTYIEPVIIGVHGERGPQGPEGPRGIQGPPGTNGQSQYMHIRYSANANGNPMTSSPQSNSKYIGLANTTSATAPSSYTSYTWALIKGDDGQDGIQGPPGQNGQPTYTWVKYADDENGSGMSNSPNGKRYIGLAFNKTTATESNNASDYNWSPLYDNVKVGGRNLVVLKDLSIDRYLLHSGDGSLASASGHATTGFIDALPETEYIFSGRLGVRQVRFVSYDVNKNYISGSLFSGDRGQYQVYKTPARAHFIRLSADYTNQSHYNMWVLGKGNIPTDWSPAPEDIQKEIDDVKEVADNAQQSADGKTTVFRQPTQPSTSNRKVGDLWFKTNEGNKMFNWTGSAWTETKLDFQALSIGKLSAISADLGDVTAGHLTGVSIKSDSTVDVTTDLRVGNNVYIGNTASGTKNIYFNPNTTGNVPYLSGSFSPQELESWLSLNSGTSTFLTVENGRVRTNGNIVTTGVISQKAFGVLNLQNGWENYGGSFALARYVRQADDMVYLMGVIRRGSTGSTVATLPVGSRPLETNIFAAGESPNGYGRIYVYADGRIVVSQGGSGFISLSGISFKVGN